MSDYKKITSKIGFARENKSWDGRGKIESARRSIKIYTRWINLKENDSDRYAWDYNHRGEDYYDIGEYDKAIADFNIVIEIDNKTNRCYTNRGNCYHKLKEYDKAIEDYQKAIKPGEDNSRIYRKISVCYKEKGNIEKAEENLYLSERKQIKSEC